MFNKYHFYLFILFCSPKILWGAQYARVVAERAVIYADKHQTSPIGYLKKGKRILVGEIPRRNNTLLPLVVAGRVAYIELKNIILKGVKGTPRADKTQNHYKKVMASRKRPSAYRDDKTDFLHFYGGIAGLGADMDALSSSVGNSPGRAASVHFAMEYRPVEKDWFTDTGISYYYFKQNDLTFASLMMEANFFYSPHVLNFSHFSFDVFGGPLISIASDLEVNSRKYQGRLFGLKTGVRLRIPFLPDWELTGIAFYKYVRTGQFDAIAVDSLSGMEFHMGLSVKI